MSRPANVTGSVSNNLVSYDSGYSAYSVSNLQNAFADSTNTSYAQINLTRNANAVTQIYYNFDTLNIPSGATINSVTCTCKCSINNTTASRVATREAQLYRGTTAMGTAYTVANSTTAFSITPGTWTADQLNSGVKLRLYAVRGTSNTTSSYYFRLYGATLSVSYTISGTEYEVTVTNNSTIATPDPSTTQYVFQGGSQEIIFNGVTDPNTIVVKDNNVEVSLTQILERKTSNFIPSSLASSSGTVTDSSNGLTNSSSTTYAQTGGQSGQYLIYSFDVSSIPSNATIISVACTAKAQHTHNNTTYGAIQLYSGSTAKGTASTFRATTTMDLDCGSWTRSELSNIRIRIGNTYTGGTTTYYTRFYGADLTVVYTVPGDYCYGYTISNISVDHTIVISDNGSSAKAYIKVNGSWVQASKVYKKVSGSWVEQTDLSNLFDQNTIYIKV